ncbi:PREDICTED: CD82 antigen isoform X3 [Chinchilla lanigera]|uniref:CD82 antigen isoform X3 n=1 Tax=Chinchilla lanigera TaxID=34839 RepID=UPI00069637B6|nr:PREDICTED: CD82 antigen isoform X3 [Chinchilla lanigera]
MYCLQSARHLTHTHTSGPHGPCLLDSPSEDSLRKSLRRSSRDRELRAQQHGGGLHQGHQVLPVPLQPALLHPGGRDPGLRGVDPGRPHQLHLRVANLLQLPAGGRLCLHRRGRGHHEHGLPGLHRRHQRGPLLAGAVLRLPAAYPRCPGGGRDPLLLQRGQAEGGDGHRGVGSHPELQRQQRGRPAGGLGLRAGAGEVLRLGQLLQLDGQRGTHESQRGRLPLLL